MLDMRSLLLLIKAGEDSGCRNSNDMKSWLIEMAQRGMISLLLYLVALLLEGNRKEHFERRPSKDGKQRELQISKTVLLEFPDKVMDEQDLWSKKTPSWRRSPLNLRQSHFGPESKEDDQERPSYQRGRDWERSREYWWVEGSKPVTQVERRGLNNSILIRANLKYNVRSLLATGHFYK